MDIKGLRGVEIKDADKGEVTAVFATYDVVDKDGDVTVEGAFTDGAPVRISAYQHMSWQGALPVGKGVIRVAGKNAILDGHFFMNTTAGRDTFEVVKQMGALQEWSYGYDALEYSFGEVDDQKVRFLSKQLVHEVSPVLLGAGVGTHTLTAKSGRSFSDEATLVLASVNAVVDRAAEVMAKRAEKGKGLGADSAALLDQLHAQLKRLDELLVEDSSPSVTPADLEREFLRFMAGSRIV